MKSTADFLDGYLTCVNVFCLINPFKLLLNHTTILGGLLRHINPYGLLPEISIMLIFARNSK